MMDLVTLVTACALGVEPKLMHALVWHQSGGEPWAVSEQGQPSPRVYSNMRDAVTDTRARPVASGMVRVGLAGLPVAPSKITPATFLPCRNVAVAAQRIAKLTDRCKTHRRLKADATFCAVAVYRGSWEQPDVKFAEAVATSVANGDAANFDMPNDTSIEFLDIASEESPYSHDSFPASASASGERDRGWSSALFPSHPRPPVNEPNDGPSVGPTAENARSSRASNARSPSAKPAADSLFVGRSSDLRPQ